MAAEGVAAAAAVEEEVETGHRRLFWLEVNVDEFDPPLPWKTSQPAQNTDHRVRVLWTK